ncbi:hypothetical protein DFH07DRAFT_971199 [Mycena maculata]|uniref:Uncharacterized protein n=1 Tax=Mycena maculata TaxID=230809 RepID=A0AAD7HN70_9AGAR|nr:hypothetical protein DFH07DRAFT_971199 [Mycena maculata]
MGSVESAALVLTGADTYVNEHSNVLEFAVQRGPSPADSIPDLESISSSSSDFEFSDFEYRIVEPCTSRGGPQHRRIDDCPNWTLPPSSTKEHDLRNEDEDKTAQKSIESTPKAPALTLGFTPIMDNPLHREPPRPDTPDPFARSQDTNTILESMCGMLGLHNPMAADPEKMMEMACIAVHQAHEAYEFFHQKAEERRQRQIKAESSVQPPFAMGLGMRTAMNDEAIKATHLVDPNVLADLADFRYFVLHGVELAQDMLVHQKADVRGATKYFFGEHNWADNVGSNTLHYSTTQRPRHSLFHDLETAKISIIQSLLRAYNYADLAHRLGHFLSLQFRDTYVLGIILDAGILDHYSPRSSPALWASDMSISSDKDMEGLTLGYPAEPGSESVHAHPEPPERHALATEVWKQEAGNKAAHERKNTMEVVPTASLAPARVEEAATRAAARELATYTPIGAFDSNEDADAEGKMCYGRTGESSAR